MNGDATNGLDQPTPLSARKVERITPDELPTVYANNVGLRTALFDFTMDFGLIVEADEERLVIKDVVTLIMSPQHAKAFAEVLTQHVEGYEEKFGPLPRIPRPEGEEPSEEDESETLE